MEQGLVSCIVPVFNGERYLAETLDSILEQTYTSREIIVADDGSTDGSARVAAGYGDRVRYLHQANGGPASARNLGLGAARGEFVAFLDADDVWHREKIQRQVARFREHPDLDICVAHIQNFWVDDLSDEATRFRDHHLARPLPGYIASTLMARRAVFETVGIFDTTLQHADNTEWFVRAAEAGTRTELLAELLAYRRMHRTNRSRCMAADSRDEYLQLVRDVVGRRQREVC